MNKKELTKKQLKGRLITITEARSTIKSELKKAYMSLKNLKSLLVGHRTGDQTLSFSDLKKIKTAARHIEDIYEDMTDEEMTDKEEKKEKEVEKKNEQSEGHGKMYNALSSIKEGKVFKMNESTLKRVVERVINEQPNNIKEQQKELYREMLRLHKTDKTGFFNKINPDAHKFADGLARLLGAKDKGAPYQWIVKEAKEKYGTILPNANDIDLLKLWYSTLEKFL